MTHHLRAVRDSVLIEIGGVLLFVLAAWLAGQALGGALDGTARVVASVVVAVVPAAIWLAAFYRQDRVAPEPKHYVVGISLLGLLLALAVGEPLIDAVFPEARSLGGPLPLAVLAAALTAGAVQEFLKYAAVRYTVYLSPHCDEPVDGVIYGASAGVGYGTAVTVAYVLALGGADLGTGAALAAVMTLAHASFGGVTGYFLGRAHCERRPVWWLPVGVLVSSLLNGVVLAVLRAAPLWGGFGYHPEYGLGAALAITALVFGTLFVLMRRLTAPALPS